MAEEILNYSVEEATRIAYVISCFAPQGRIEEIAKVMYPEESKKDIDGDWYDTNTGKREGFIVGCKTVLKQCGVDIDD